MQRLRLLPLILFPFLHSLVPAADSQPDLEFFPSRLHAAVFRNWDIVPHDRLAVVLGGDKAAVEKIGASLGLPPVRALTPEENRRNIEIILRRNWGVLPRAQIEGLLNYTPAQLDDFLGKEIFLRALLAAPPPGLQTVKIESPTPEIAKRAEWFRANVTRHLDAVSDTFEEPRLAFTKALSHAHRSGEFIPGSKPRAGDVNLLKGWTLMLPEKPGPVAQQAADDFVDYCRHSQRTKLRVQSEATAAGTNTIQLQLDASLPTDETFALQFTPTNATIRARSEIGLARALVELEHRMSERGGPFLAPCAEINSPTFSPRYVFSYISLLTDVLGQDQVDPFPDGYLNEIFHQDADGVWVYALLQDLVASPVFPEIPHAGSEERLKRLRSMVDRDARHGLKVYLYLNEPRAQPLAFFEKHPDLKGQPEGDTAALCTSTPEVQAHLRKSFEKLFHDVPGLGGVFVITASENLANCYSHTAKPSCPRCSKRPAADVIAESIRCMAEGTWAASPQAKFIVWDWSWHGVLGEAAPEQIIAQLPKGVQLMADFERGTQIQRGGITTPVEEYSISVVGPSPRAKIRSAQAKKYGFDFLAKIQLSTTWECGTVPFIPVPALLSRKAEALHSVGVSGVMATWTIGSYPSPNTEAFAVWNWNPSLTETEVLARVAARRYGPAAARFAVSGWTKLSNAFTEEYPFTQSPYAGPLQQGPSIPLYRRDIPPPYGSATLLNCKDDWQHWSPPWPPAQMAQLLRHLCDRWDEGLADLKRIPEFAPPDRRRLARQDYGVAWMVGYYYRAFADAIDFYQARDAGDEAAMRRIATAQMKPTEDALRLVRSDSRLGWEPELQYFYRPQDVLERLISLDAVLTPP